MQISRCLSLACVVTAFLAPFVVNAQSSSKSKTQPAIVPTPADPSQIEKARAAMREKMSNLQPGETGTQPVLPAPAPAPDVHLVTPTTPQPAQPAIEPYTLTPAAPQGKTAKEIIAEEEKARAAAEKEQRRLDQEEQKRRAAMEKENRRLAQQAEKERAAAEKAAAREAARGGDKVAPLHATAPAPAPAPAPTVTTPTAAFQPLTAPPAAIPTTKEQRLQKLLNDYRTDKISPQQFHEERAKILAE